MLPNFTNYIIYYFYEFQAGIYAVYVRRQLIICATLVHIHCAEVAFGSLIMFVLEVIKASALFA